MKKNSNQVVFTDWYMVSINDDNNRYEIPVPKFLKELEKKLESKSYNVFFDNEKKVFYITYCGVDYDVILNNKEQNSLLSNNYSPLVLKLLWLASLEKKYNDEAALQNVRKAKIEAIIKSNYEDMESLEDYELFLDYLKSSLKNAKTIEEKNTINTKIANIVKTINEMKKEEKQKEENPLNLQLYINRYIYDILKQVNKLDEKDRKKVAAELRKILVDFKKIVDDYNKKKDTGLFIGNPMLPMDILERIIDVEFELKTLLKSKDLSNYIDSELGDIEEELNSVIHSKNNKESE